MIIKYVFIKLLILIYKNLLIVVISKVHFFL
nr:MAG TPA: hypothetical protein [Caudoviricetes sp.]